MDRLVVERGLAPTREKARRWILAGEVLVDETPVDKPGAWVDRDARVRLRRPLPPFVGRGGEKLAGALDQLGLSVEGLAVLDIGASTGGFTDCLLQRGARWVTALDVGRAQLDWKLRQDPRVQIREGVNARYLRPEDFSQPFDLVTIDVSFISLAKILPVVPPLLGASGKVLALVKPQFELERDDVGSGGIVRDPALHQRAVVSVAQIARQSRLAIDAVIASPLPGTEGNREFFLLMHVSGLQPEGLDEGSFEERIRDVCGSR